MVKVNIAQDLKSAIKLSVSERYDDANDAYEKLINQLMRMHISFMEKIFCKVI
jgi:hypothetical protein